MGLCVWIGCSSRMRGGGGEDGDLNSGFCPVLKKLGQMPSRAPSLTDGWLPGMMGLCLRCQPAATPTKSGWGVGADFHRSWTKKKCLQVISRDFPHHEHERCNHVSVQMKTRDDPESHSPLTPLIPSCYYARWARFPGSVGDNSFHRKSHECSCVFRSLRKSLSLSWCLNPRQLLRKGWFSTLNSPSTVPKHQQSVLWMPLIGFLLKFHTGANDCPLLVDERMKHQPHTRSVTPQMRIWNDFIFAHLVLTQGETVWTVTCTCMMSVATGWVITFSSLGRGLPPLSGHAHDCPWIGAPAHLPVMWSTFCFPRCEYLVKH